MGKHKHPTVGYGYAIDFVYGFCEKADVVSGYKMAGDLMWEGWLVESGAAIRASTGKRADVYKSDFKGPSIIQMWLGDVTPNQLMSGMTYKGTVLAHFRNYCTGSSSGSYYVSGNQWCFCLDVGGDMSSWPCCHKDWDKYCMNEDPCGGGGGGDTSTNPCKADLEQPCNCLPYSVVSSTNPEAAFVGDNTTAIPEYEFRFHRYNIFKDIFGSSVQVIRGVNPAVVIADILVNYLKIDQSRIDWDSFKYVANILAGESLGLSFLLTRRKKALDWIKEILRYVDGILYFDIYKDQYVLKIFRRDYDENNLMVIDESNVSSLTIEQTGWTDIVTTFSFKYQHDWEGRTNTYEIINSAAIEVNGYETTKEFDFLMASGPECLPQLMTRAIQKHGMPATKAKFRINYMLGQLLRPGDVIRLESSCLRIPTHIFRIIKIGGDKDDDPYLDIEAVNDVYANPTDVLEIPDAVFQKDLDFNLEGTPAHYHLFAMPHEYCHTDNMTDNSWMVIAAPNEAHDYVDGVRMTNAFTESPVYAKPWQYGTVLKTSIDGFENHDGNYVGYSHDFKILFQNLYTTVVDENGNETKHYRFTHNILMSDSEFQVGMMVGFMPAKPGFFHIKKLELQDDDTVLLTGYADPLVWSEPDYWYNGSHDTLYDVSLNPNTIFIRMYQRLTIEETISFESNSPSCHGESTYNLLTFSLVNQYSTSSEVTVEATQCFDYWRPLAPFNIVVTDMSGEGINRDILGPNTCIAILPFNGTLEDLQDQFPATYLPTDADEDGTQDEPTYIQGVFNEGILLDGSHYLEISNMLSIGSGKGAISLWFRADPNVSTPQCIFDFHKNTVRNWSVFVEVDDLVFYMHGEEVYRGIGLVAAKNKWNHLVTTSDGLLYLNGKLIADVGRVVNPSLLNKAIWFGASRSEDDINVPTNFFHGAIDHIRVFNRSVDEESAAILNGETATVGNFYEIKMRPRHYKLGATNQIADEWNGYADEGVMWGSYAIEKATSSFGRESFYTNIPSQFADYEGWIRVTIDKEVADSHNNWRIFAWASHLGGSVNDGSYRGYGYDWLQFNYVRRFTITGGDYPVTP